MPFTRRLLRFTLLIGLPLALLPALLPRKVFAKGRPGSAHSSTGPADRRATPRNQTLQDLVDEFRGRMSIESPVFVSLVAQNKLVVSVEQLPAREGAFTLSMEEDFIDGLTDEELRAVVAHELGHVWIFTHHPYLQTEELANQMALQLVSRDVLERVYDKVWKWTGTKGTLSYLPVQ